MSECDYQVLIDEIKNDFLSYAEENYIDNLTINAKKLFNELSREKLSIVNPSIEDITLYHYDSKFGPVDYNRSGEEKPLDNYENGLIKCMDAVKDLSLKFTGSYDGKHVHMLDFSVGKDDYVIFITTPKFVKFEKKEKEEILNNYINAINDINSQEIEQDDYDDCKKKVLDNLSELIKKGYNNYWNGTSFEKKKNSAPILDYIIINFDERDGPVIKNNQINERITESLNDNLKNDLSRLLDMTSEDSELKIIGKKDGLYYHPVSFNVYDTAFRGNNSMYCIVIVTEDDDLSDRKIELNKSLFKNLISNYHKVNHAPVNQEFIKEGLRMYNDNYNNALSSTLASADEIFTNYLIETQDKSMTIDKKAVLDKLKNHFKQKL